MRIPAVLLLQLLLCLAGPPPVSGCVCASYPGPFCAWDLDRLAAEGDVVFVGTVLSIDPESAEEIYQQTLNFMAEEHKHSFTSLQEARETEPSDEWERAFDEAARQTALALYADRLLSTKLAKLRTAETQMELEDALDLLDMSRRVRFELLESLVGELAESVEVMTGFSAGDCGIGFQKGETYLVEAWKDEDGRFQAWACSSRVMHIEDAQEDLATLRAWKRGEPQPSFIHGRLVDWNERRDSRPAKPATAHASLRLVGGDEPIGVSTDEFGRFRFGDLTNQTYQLKLELPGWRFAAESDVQMEIDLAQRGCAELSLRIEKDED